MTSKITKGLFGPHIKVTYKHTCNDECLPDGGTHVMYKPEQTFQQKVEFIMEDMLPYYEDLHDIAKEIAMWADDYVAMTEQLARP